MPYNSPYKLPIPTSLRPSFTGAATNIDYPDVSNSALFTFAGGASINFGIRFTGAGRTQTVRDPSGAQARYLMAHPHPCVLLRLLRRK